MSLKEHRWAIRKICAFPHRFRVSTNSTNDQEEGGETAEETVASSAPAPGAECINKALNLSESGVYFTCRE